MLTRRHRQPGLVCQRFCWERTGRHLSYDSSREPNATHIAGRVAHDDLIGMPWGTQVTSHLGEPLRLLRPSTDDIVRNLKRSTQIVYPKDAGHILMKLSIAPGCREIEEGTGSGGLTLVSAQTVHRTGWVMSYETRPAVQQLARENLEQLGLSEYVNFRERDIAEGFEEHGVDGLILDVAVP